LKLAFPEDGTVGNADDKTGSTSDTMRILGILFGVEASEVSIRITIKLDIL
jgi:hypothetical protein